MACVKKRFKLNGLTLNAGLLLSSAEFSFEVIII